LSLIKGYYYSDTDSLKKQMMSLWWRVNLSSYCTPYQQNVFPCKCSVVINMHIYRYVHNWKHA
jgi:hypothetical protein